MTRVLMVGGGHTHLVAAPLLAARAALRVRLQLLAPEPLLLYSGMMPGWIAGQYAFDACAIDLARVAEGAGIEWVQDTLVDVDFGAREAVGADGRRYPYDLLSLNVGSATHRGELAADARACVLGAKPFSDFVAGWRRWLARAPRTPHCLVAGGGAAGVEIAFALAALCGGGRDLAGGRVELAAPGERLLPGHAPIASALAERALRARGIAIRLGTRYLGADRDGVRLADEASDGRLARIDPDLVIVATGARPPAWLGRAARAHGLDVADDGGLAVRGDLRTPSNDRVFAGGDCASFIDRPVPKAGVHALRQGPALAASIARRLGDLDPSALVRSDTEPADYRPQRIALALLNRCDGTAIASWGPFAAAGAPVWRWKDHIDRAFVDTFRRGAAPEPQGGCRMQAHSRAADAVHSDSGRPDAGRRPPRGRPLVPRMRSGRSLVNASDRITVVIPALDEAACIGAAVRGAARQVRRVIVVDGGSRDPTSVLAAEAGAAVVTAPRGRASQMNVGAALADTEWLLFLHADCRLPDGAADAIVAASAAGRRWGRFDVRLASPRRSLAVVAAMMNLRSRATSIATGDQAIFVERTLFESLGGYAPIPLMEDVELCMRLRRIARPARVRLCVEVSARRWEQRGVLRTVLEMWAWRAAYALGASPGWLHRRYYGRR